MGDEFKSRALNNEIERAAKGATGAIGELRHILNRIERDIADGRKPTVSNTHVMTELFNRLGMYEALLTAQEILKA